MKHPNTIFIRPSEKNPVTGEWVAGQWNIFGTMGKVKYVRADQLEYMQDYVDKLNDLCAEFGCVPGESRLEWLREQLEKCHEN